MKVSGNGQAKILNPRELQRLFAKGFNSERDCALFAICLFSGCRIGEALQLRTADICDNKITFRKNTTKGRLSTREIDIPIPLAEILARYDAPPGFLFPGQQGVSSTGHLSRYAADRILRKACQRVGICGASTHSFRRTALTQMHNSGIPLRHIQEISGHKDLGTLQRYLEVSEDQKKKAVGVIGW